LNSAPTRSSGKVDSVGDEEPQILYDFSTPILRIPRYMILGLTITKDVPEVSETGNYRGIGNHEGIGASAIITRVKEGNASRIVFF
jgi:hypothetical protein